MTIEQWQNLSLENREKLISAVFNSSYLALTHAGLNPKEDSIINEVLRVTSINGDKAYINIHKEIKVI